MQLGFKYGHCQGFSRLYNYGLKHYPNHMITKEAEQRERILLFWRKYGLEATKEAYSIKRPTLYNWWKKYKDSGYLLTSLNPKSQARKTNNKRIIHPEILKEIKRLRLKVTPNMGKSKIKRNLDPFCQKNNLPIYSESKIGRIIKEKKIYHHRQKISHFGKVKEAKRSKKIRKPKGFEAREPGELIEVDTVVKFAWGIKRYIITAVDVHSRFSFALAYKKHDSHSTRDFFQKLEQVFPYKIKAVQTDNGSEFHKDFKQYLKKKNIKHYWNYPGRPYRQGHIEKYNRTIQEEFVDWNEVLLEDINIFNQKLVDWLVWYNTKRFHWGLSLETPVNYLINNNLLSKMRWTDTNFCKILKKVV